MIILTIYLGAYYVPSTTLQNHHLIRSSHSNPIGEKNEKLLRKDGESGASRG